MRRIALLLFASLLCSQGLAQTKKLSQAHGLRMLVTGTVYDIQGSVITSGRVTARSAEGKQYNVTTNDEGTYKLELPLAVYKLSASAGGFCLTTVERFIVVNSTFGKMSQDLVLEVANGQPGCKHETIRRKPHRRRQGALNRIAE